MNLIKAFLTFTRGIKETHDIFSSIYAVFQKRIDNILLNKGKIIIKKDTMEWMLKLLLDKDIQVEKFDHIEVLNDYFFQKINDDDIVLDIGAGAGLYSLLVAKVAKKVYSIEPLLIDVLLENTRNVSNIEVLPIAFGRDGEEECNYWGMSKVIESKSLQTLLYELNPAPTYIKCDCEGCEWNGFMSCNDFKDIRMIEMEYHTQISNELWKLVSHLKNKGFSVTVKPSYSCDFRYIGMLNAEK